jgi:hypothetical protein
MCQYGTPSSPVSRTYLFGSIHLRHRIGYGPSGQGLHSNPPHAETFNSSFWSQCRQWAGNVNHFTKRYGVRREVDWVGEVGTVACRAGMHPLGRAIDLTRIQLVGNYSVDMNWSWRAQRDISHQRRYLAAVANCRRFFGTVLTCWYNAAHHDHIHVDNGTPVGPLRSVRSDTTLIQASCNLLDGASLAIDGRWGPLTEAAYVELKNKFDMATYNPRGNTSHAQYFLELVLMHGYANQAAGAYPSGGGWGGQDLEDPSLPEVPPIEPDIPPLLDEVDIGEVLEDVL